MLTLSLSLSLCRQVRNTYSLTTTLLAGLALATICTFTRSCFRIAELSQGFSGPLANDEITFMVNNYPLLPEIVCVCVCVCVYVCSWGE